MKNPLIYIIFILIIFACGEDVSFEKNDNDSLPTDLNANTKNDIFKGNLKDTTDFKCQEWYPGGEQIKIEGGLDRQKRRHGKWISYFDNGKECSMTTYTHGLRQGFSIVKYPNGTINYMGEYNKDKQVGQWKFYNEKGKKVNEVNYDN
ncbi:hypothetical protein N9335_04010 [Crocinitomicaceae bacterium]|nr:hypothetical protein [Crocinitomicaceae bacterium]